jgi:uncharacterized membrane protein YjdF
MEQLTRIPLGTILYYGLRTLVGMAAALFALNGRWVDAISAAFILLLMLVPSLLRRRYRLSLPFELEFAIAIFVFLTLFLGSLNDFYERYAWWDTLLHFQSGILLGMLGFVLIYLVNRAGMGKIVLSPFFLAFFAACFSMAVSVVWEIYEYAADSLFGFSMQRTGLDDTMGDLIVNTVGALAVAIIAYLWIHMRQRIPFTSKRLAGSWYDPDRAD